MGKRVKSIGIGLLLLLGAGSLMLGYFWHQATKLPEWYANDLTNSSGQANVQAQAAQVEQKIQAQIQHNQQSDPDIPIEVQLTGDELNQLVTAKLVEKSEKSHLSPAVKGLNTQVVGDRLKTGAVVDLANLPASRLRAQEKMLVDEMTQKFPALANRQIYIGIEGKPQVKQGRLQLDNATKVQVGDLSFTLRELANRLGIPEATLQEKLNLELSLGDLKVQAIELKGGKALLTGAAQNVLP